MIEIRWNYFYLRSFRKVFGKGEYFLPLQVGMGRQEALGVGSTLAKTRVFPEPGGGWVPCAPPLPLRPHVLSGFTSGWPTS